MLLSRTETDPEDPPGSRPILAKRELATSVVVLGGAPAFLDIENMSWCFLDAIQVFLGPRSADSPVPGDCLTDAPDHEWHLGLWCPRSGEGGLQVLRTWDDPGNVRVLTRANRSRACEAKRLPNLFHSCPVLLLFNVSTGLELIEPEAGQSSAVLTGSKRRELSSLCCQSSCTLSANQASPLCECSWGRTRSFPEFYVFSFLSLRLSTSVSSHSDSTGASSCLFVGAVHVGSGLRTQIHAGLPLVQQRT